MIYHGIKYVKHKKTTTILVVVLPEASCCSAIARSGSIEILRLAFSCLFLLQSTVYIIAYKSNFVNSVSEFT